MSTLIRTSSRVLALVAVPLLINGCAAPGEQSFSTCVATSTAVGTGVGAVGGAAGAMAGAGVGSLAALAVCRSPETDQSLEPPTITDAPALVDTTPMLECEGGRTTRSGACRVNLSSDLVTTFEDGRDISGTLTNAEVRRIPDPRPQCQIDPRPGSEELVLDEFEGEGGGYLTIPAYLCGIPNAEGTPEIALVDVEGDLTVTNTVIFHEAANPASNRDYACRDRFNRDSVPGDFSESTQPVFAWLPRKNEIPVTDADGRVVNVVEDLTNECGSYRGGTGRMSYMVYNLHHVEDADYQAITAGDVEQLGVTLDQTEACISEGAEDIQATVDPLVATIKADVEAGEYNSALDRLLDLGALLDPLPERGFPQALPPELKGKSLTARVESCYYNPMAVPPIQAAPATPTPRNFRGDLLSQVEHVRYMLVTMLGAEESLNINIKFATDSADLPGDAAARVQQAVDFVRRHPDARFVLVGHTDASGTDEYNLQLSLQRAEALRAGLIAAGVDPDRIDVRGEGEESPIASNDTETGRASNRRVEVSLLD